MSCAAGFTTDIRPSPATLSGAVKVGKTDDFSQRTLARRYLAVLNRFSPEQVRSADRNPIEYTYPYLHLLAVEVFARLQRQSFLIEQQYYGGDSARAQTEALEEGWAIVHDTRLYMTNSQKSLEQFAKAGVFTSQQSAEVLKDFRTLMGQIRLIQGDLRDYLSRHVGMLALQDSKKSIEQAVTMNGLTKLAFVFIPLNFVTSAFGMNLTSLGTGKAEIWMVVVSCVLLGGVVLVVVAIALSRSKAASGLISDQADAGSKTFRTLWTLFKSSPQEAFWFLVFVILNSPEDCRDFSMAVHRDPFAEWTERDHNDYPNRQPCFELPAFNRLSNRSFWERRARGMNRVLVGIQRDQECVKI
jgi:CorA-like Mg2+ transporter protein